MPERDPDRLEDLEIDLLLEGVFRQYGYDFRDYARASLKRRIWKAVHDEGLETVSALQDRVLHDVACFDRLLVLLCVNVTAMFRDPGTYRAFRARVVPYLRTFPSIQIWHAGCGTGEEAYSMAILLAEEGLHDRCRLFATDISENALGQARSGVVPITAMKQHTANYLEAGGMRSFSEYYTALDGHALFRSGLRENVVFARHNLATDASFNEFEAILCRNVMIYFNRTLQDRVHRLLYSSLRRLGFLVLGRKESLRFSPFESCYREVDADERIYQKVQ